MSGFAYTDLFRGNLPAPAKPSNPLPDFPMSGGHNDPLGIPVAELAEAARNVVLRHGSKLAIYALGQDTRQGYDELRALVATKAEKFGMKIQPSNVLITGGSGPAIELVNKLFLNPGDTVIMEEFSFEGAMNKARAVGAKVVGAATDAEGLVPEKLDDQLRQLAASGVKPKYIYLIPTIQNPTGTILSVERRRKLLEVAARHGVPIFEDDCYADLTWSGSPPPAIYALDPTRVVHIGTFSKSFAPAIRLGYVIADWSVISQMLPLKTDAGTGALDQMVVAEYLTGRFDAHVQSLAGELRSKCAYMIECVDESFGSSAVVQPPQGGIFIWLKLPGVVDGRELVTAAAKKGVSCNAGAEWACDPAAGRNYLRLCFALPTREQIREGIVRLASTCFDLYGVPARSSNLQNRAG